MAILKPDSSLNLYKIYNYSNKALIPLLISSFVMNKINFEYEKPIHYLNILNMSYHSYFSTSSIITDYLKPKNYNFFARVLNLKLHGMAGLGLLYFINQT